MTVLNQGRDLHASLICTTEIVQNREIDGRCTKLCLRMIRAVLSQTGKLSGNGDKMWVRHCSVSSKLGKDSIKAALLHIWAHETLFTGRN